MPADDPEMPVCLLRYESNGVECDEADVLANACLIAAAPAMLDALQEARAALHQHYVDWDGEPEDAVPLQLARAKCDAAIALATQSPIIKGGSDAF